MLISIIVLAALVVLAVATTVYRSDKIKGAWAEYVAIVKSLGTKEVLAECKDDLKHAWNVTRKALGNLWQAFKLVGLWLSVPFIVFVGFPLVLLLVCLTLTFVPNRQV